MAFKPTVGLDIGSQQIKAVELKPSKGGKLTISAIGIAPTPVGVMQNNIITDPHVMGQAVRQLMRESGITTKRVIGSVAGQSAVVIRIIEVPRMTDAELKETMRWEVERHVPFAPSETIIDYQPLVPLDPAAAGSPNMEVLLAVAQQDIIANYVDTVFAAGLDPAAIDIEPLAVSRATLDLVDGRPVARGATPPPPANTDYGMMASGFGGAQETVAIVNIGAANTDISIFQNGQLAFPRSLPLAGDSLTRAIADLMGYPLEQAERVKRDYATIQLDRMAVYTGTYYGDEPNFEAPQFGEEDAGTFRAGAPSSRLRGSFGEELGTPFDLGHEGPQFDDLDRTQPMASTTLNLSKPVAPGEGLPFVPPADEGFSVAGAPADDENLRNQVFEAVAPVLGELSTELRRSLDYYRSRAQGRSVDRVLLTGGSACLGNLGPFLQRELQVPVLVADPLMGLDVTAKHYDPQYLQLISPVFTIALGLAARDAVFEANPAPRPVKAPRVPKGAKTGVTTGEPTNPPVS
jgi:type IV pilus assembly protein PilM